jgi:menaquinone reductase, multiheme cytochrome c subunit
MGGSILPPWVDRARPLAGALLVVLPVYVVALVYYGGSPRTTDVGYAPEQPVAYSHALHVGQLGLDCRYCHTTVETSAHAALPPTSVCMNCHARIGADSKKLLAVRESEATGMPIRWVRVHDLADFVYFDHSAHVSRGVSCVSCHGRVDKMERVRQVETLSMGWCLDCHRHPEPHLRPRQFVTDLGWQPAQDPAVLGKRIRAENNIHPSTDCSTCHR